MAPELTRLARSISSGVTNNSQIIPEATRIPTPWSILTETFRRGYGRLGAQGTRAASTVGGRTAMMTGLQRAPAAQILPHASVGPESLADIVKNDLAVLCTALELVQDQVVLPLELRVLVSGALARSTEMADHVRDLQRCSAARDGIHRD
jgi:hypothetical protein